MVRARARCSRNRCSCAAAGSVKTHDVLVAGRKTFRMEAWVRAVLPQTLLLPFAKGQCTGG
jgi:hypothetical protein